MLTQLLRSALLFLTLVPWGAHASVMFTEVMYDVAGADDGHEWVEIQNTDNVPIDLTGFKLFEADTNHKVTVLKGSSIAPQGYAIIAADASKFMADWPEFSGVLFDSSFSLSNTGETLILKNASSTPLATLAYSATGGAAGDGNSLNAVNGSWLPRMPSPGAAALASAAVPESKAVVPPKQKAPPPAPHISPAPTTSGAQAAAAHSSVSFGILPWVGGVLVIAAIGIAVVLLEPKRKEVDDYTIEEQL